MTQTSTPQSPRLADWLNRDCHCIDVDRDRLREHLVARLRGSGLADPRQDLGDYPFASFPVFVSQDHVEAMARFVSAFESVADTAAVREQLLARAPATARQDFGTRGVFFSYDFHLAADGPRLIEVNTNAGGALLNLYLAAAQKACCAEVDSLFGGQPDLAAAERGIVDMFREEYRLQRGGRKLRSIAIVDEHPETQPLYPEFVLFRSLFQRHGIDAVIASPEDLGRHGAELRVGNQAIDLVYNRLTDFYLQAPGSAVLREAYLAGAIVLTPSPSHYARYADKRNLPLMSDDAKLAELGVGTEERRILGSGLPRVVAVCRENADELWAGRKQLYFKPATGFGSRGAYRGAKLTRRVWAEILESEYVAQTIVPPSERRIVIDGEARSLKVDLRCVTYAGAIQQLSARLYQGQTTNLRTEGGGLATVFATAAGTVRAACGINDVSAPVAVS